MRVARFALLGLASGAIIGLIAACLFVALWYDILRIGSHGADGLGGFGALVALAVILPLLGGIGGAVWLAARARKAPAAGGPSCALVVALLLAPLLILCVTLISWMG